MKPTRSSWFWHSFRVKAVLTATLVLAQSSSSALPDERRQIAAGCPKGTDEAVIGGKRVCLKIGVRCQRKYQAQYVRLGYSCNAGGRLDLLSCTGASYYAVIGGVHGCLRVGKACLTKHQAQYRKLGFECERGRLIRPKPINARITVTGPEKVIFDWSRDKCEDIDIPDLPARALRDADGNVQLLISGSSTRRLIGPDFDRLRHDCTVVLG